MFRRFAPVVLLTACMLLSASVAPAAEDYMKLVPEDALGLVVVNNPAALDAKIQEFGQKMHLPIPPLMAMLERWNIRKALDEKGTVAIVILPMAERLKDTDGEGPFVGMLLVPTTDFDKLIETFSAKKLSDQPVYEIRNSDYHSCIRNLGGYTAVTEFASHEALFEKNLKLAKQAPANLAAWREWLGGYDAAGVILPPGIKFISSNVQKELRKSKEQLGSMPQMQSMAGVFDMYGKILQTAEREAAGYGVGLTLDKQSNVVLNDRLLLKPGGKLASVVEKIRPLRMNLLAGLPDGKFVFAGGAYIPDEVMQTVMKFSMNMVTSMREVYGLSDEEVEKLSKMQTVSMKGIRSISFSMLSEPVEGSIYSTMSGIMRVDDSAEFLKSYQQWFKRYTEVLNGVDSPMLAKMEVEATDFDGKSALKVTTILPKIMEGMPEEMHGTMMQTLFGPDEKLVAWLVPVDKNTVVMGYESKDFLRRVIKSVKEGGAKLSEQSQLKQTAELLPANAVAVGYLSPSGFLDYIKRIVSSVAPPAVAMMPDFPETPPIGFAVTTGRNEVSCRMVIPFETIRGGMMAWQQMMMRQFAPPPPPEVP